MSLFEDAMNELKLNVLNELEQVLMERLQPKIQQELYGRHMTIAETAQYLHVSEQTIRRMVGDKDLPSFRVRNVILVRQMDVDEWIRKQIESQ